MNKPTRRRSLSTALYDNPYLLVLVTVLIAVAGLSAFLTVPRLEDPIITQRNAIIIVPAPGASAARVEALITEKIETELQEIEAIKEIESTSSAGIATLSLELVDQVDASTNEQVFAEIRDKLSDARNEFPAEALPPVFDSNRGAVAFTYLVALTWDDGSSTPQMGILSRQAEILADEFRNVSGTELVRIYGAVEEEVSVLIDPEESTALGLTPQAIVQAIQAGDSKVPAGLLRDSEADLLIEVDGAINDLDRVRRIPVREGDRSQQITVEDIATVESDWQRPVETLAQTSGKRAVYVAARVQPERQAGQWTEQIETALTHFQTELGSGISAAVVFEQNKYTAQRLSELINNLLLGAGLVLIIVLLTMGWRPALIVGSAIPLTACLVLVTMAYSGGKLHQMSIFGMIIALGLLIDNAIVATDGLLRNLRSGMPPREAIQTTIGHLLIPLLSSTTTTVLAFMPILLLPGSVGDFVGSIGTNVVVALIASFLISMTLITTFAARFSSTSGSSERKDHWLTRGLAFRRTGPLLKKILQRAYAHPWKTMAGAALVPVIGFALTSVMGSQFFPRVDRDQFNLKLWLEPNASIARTEAVIQSVEATLLEDEAIEGVSWMLGSSFPSVYYNLVMDQENVSEYAQATVKARDSESVKRLIPRLQAELDRSFPQAQIVITQFAQGPPSSSDLEFRIYGPDLTTLQDLGESVRAELAKQPGVLHSRATVTQGQPKVRFEPDEPAIRLAGLGLVDVASQLNFILEGAIGGSMIEGLEELPVRVRYAEEPRSRFEQIEATNLHSPVTNAWVPLTELGSLQLEPELESITRRNGERVNIVRGYTSNQALPIEVTQNALAGLKASGFELPPNYRLELGGESENQKDAIANLVFNIPILVTLTISVLILAFRSVTIAAIVSMAAGLSVGVGLLATFFMSFPISFNTLLGSLGLLGLAFNSSIIVVAEIRKHKNASTGDAITIASAVGQTGRHLLSTTLTTVGGFLPLILFVGGDFWPPLAVVMAGGVIGSTLLAITFTPAVYCLAAKRGLV